MDRPIKPNEIEVVRWMLDNAAVCDVTKYRELQLDHLRVLPSKCKCGCASLDFEERAWGRASVIADAVAVYPDGQKAGLILFGNEGKLTMLEIYELDPVADRFPEVSNLEPF